MKEVWKPVVGYEGLYEVSSEGRVKSLARVVKTKKGGRKVSGGILKPNPQRNEYLRVTLYKDCKPISYLLHRLVLLAFKENIENKPQVNHINEIKSDNRLENLEWVTRSENMNHGTAMERMAEKQSIPVKGVNIDTGETIYFKSVQEAGRNGFNPPHIVACCKGKRNKHLRFIWSYA